MAGEDRAALLIREMAGDLLADPRRLDQLEAEIAALVQGYAALIATFPGMGPTPTAEFLAIVQDTDRFDSGDALAAAAGLAPGLSQSGKVRYNCGLTSGDRALKRVFYQSAFCAL